MPTPKPAPETKKECAIVIHGGTLVSKVDEERREREEAVLKNALELGTKILGEGKSSLLTVEVVLRFLDDSPDFNAAINADQRREEPTILAGSIFVCADFSQAVEVEQ